MTPNYTRGWYKILAQPGGCRARGGINFCPFVTSCQAKEKGWYSGLAQSGPPVDQTNVSGKRMCLENPCFKFILLFWPQQGPRPPTQPMEFHLCSSDSGRFRWRWRSRKRPSSHKLTTMSLALLRSSDFFVRSIQISISTLIFEHALPRFETGEEPTAAMVART